MNDSLSEKISAIVTLANEAVNANYLMGERFDERLREFTKAFPSEYPRTPDDVIDLAKLKLSGGYLPDAGSIQRLEHIIRDEAGFSRGELVWSYIHPNISIAFFPKDTGARYDFTFIPMRSQLPLSFPIEVKVDIWSDMDIPRNHQDCCTSLGYTDDEVVEGTCYCQPSITQSIRRRFATRGIWNEGIVDFLHSAVFQYGSGIEDESTEKQ
jgi:hypothetical protein